MITFVYTFQMWFYPWDSYSAGRFFTSEVKMSQRVLLYCNPQSGTLPPSGHSAYVNEVVAHPCLTLIVCVRENNSFLSWLKSETTLLPHRHQWAKRHIHTHRKREKFLSISETLLKPWGVSLIWDLVMVQVSFYINYFMLPSERKESRFSERKKY